MTNVLVEDTAGNFRTPVISKVSLVSANQTLLAVAARRWRWVIHRQTMMGEKVPFGRATPVIQDCSGRQRYEGAAYDSFVIE